VSEDRISNTMSESLLQENGKGLMALNVLINVKKIEGY
jgi:negative regulator of genetic competence, sporulation and motility